MFEHLLYIGVCLVAAAWLLLFPKQVVFLLSKYQLFLYRYFSFIPFFPFKSEEEAAAPVFNVRFVRSIGAFNIFIALVLASKAPW